MMLADKRDEKSDEKNALYLHYLACNILVCKLLGF